MKRLTYATALAALLSLGLAGCAQQGKGTEAGFFKEAASTAGQVSETTKKSLGTAIDTYCRNVSVVARLALRSQVNAYAEQGTIKIDCGGDAAGGDDGDGAD